MVLFKKKSQGGDKKKKEKGSSLGRSRKERTRSSTPSEPTVTQTPTQTVHETEADVPARKLQHAFTDLAEKQPIEEVEEEKVTVNLPVICRAQAICSYEADQMDEVDDEITFLQFSKGDMIDVVEQDESGWWEGIVDGEWGIFPGSYVEVIEVYEIIDDENDENGEVEEIHDSEITNDSFMEENESKRSSSSSLEKEGQEMDDMLSDLISAYETDISAKEPAPLPFSEDEEELEYLDGPDDAPQQPQDDPDEFFENEGDIVDDIDNAGYFPEADFVFGSGVEARSSPAATSTPEKSIENQNQGNDEYQQELERLRQATAQKERQMNELLLKHAKTARQLDDFLKGEQQKKLQNDLDKAMEQITSLKIKLAGSNAFKEQAEEEISQLQRKLQFTQSELEKVRSLQQNGVEERNKIDEENVALRNEVNGLRAQLETVTQKLHNSETEVGHLRKQVEDSLEKKSEDSQLKSLQSRLNELQDTVQRKEAIIQNREEKVLQLETINSSLVLKIQTLTMDSRGAIDCKEDNVKLLEEQVKELTAQKNSLAEKLRDAAESEIRLTTEVEKLKQARVVEETPTTKHPPAVSQTAPPQQNRGGRGGAPVRGGRPRGRPRGSTRGTNPARGGAPAARGNGAPRGGAAPTKTGNNPSSGPPKGPARGTVSRPTFSRPPGPQGRPIQRKLISNIPSTPPPAPHTEENE